LFFDFCRRCRELGIELPIIAGVMPVYSVKMTRSLASLCGASTTEELGRQLAGLPEGDKEAAVQLGIEFATSQCRGLAQARVAGVHLCTMDRSRSVVEIVNRLRADGLL
jgi:methylenetetrahydrofolate reductase (NADPH)